MLDSIIANHIRFNPDPAKRKILWVGEFSGAHTGFAHMAKHYLSYLFSTGKYNIVELCTGIGWNDPKTNIMPWPVVPNSPKVGESDPLQIEVGIWNRTLASVPEQDRGGEQAKMTFGKFRYRDVLREYQPDIILDGRDIWNMDWELSIPETNYSTLIWQPMVDGNPHPPEWLELYKKADYFIAFSHFAKKVVRNEGGVKVLDVIPAGVNIKNFKPLHSRKEILESFGLPGNLKVFGFVARNQIRKRFPELISSFTLALQKNIRLMKDARLLLYTNFQDAGWPMHEEIVKAGIQNFVLVPLVCHNCRSYTIIPWSSNGWTWKNGRMFRTCSKCKEISLATPSTDFGLSEPEFNVIYNMMYWYIHLASREGQGLPVCESKAAGLPGAYNDTAALTEQAGRSEDAWNMPTGAWLIRNKDHYVEVSTRMYAACPDKGHTAETFVKAIKLPQEQWNQMSEEARTLAEKCYDWDVLGQKWERILDSVALKAAPIPMVTISAKSRCPNPDAEISLETNDPKQWVRDLFTKVLDTNAAENVEFDRWVQTAQEGKASRKKMLTYFQKVAYKDSLLLGTAPQNVKRILYVMPRTAGDVYLSTAVTHGIKSKYPNCEIDFATLPGYMELLEGCPWISKVIPYEDSFMDHRQWEGIFGNKPKYEIVFTPSLVTQSFPHSHFHGGKNEDLVETYANFCNVEVGNFYIPVDEEICRTRKLPEKYIVFHSKTGMSSKDYAQWKFVIDFLDYPVVQLGAKDDYSLISINNRLVDLRGLKWTESFGILKHATAFIGGDSIMGHIARHFNIPGVIPFGATLPNKVFHPKENDSMKTIIPLNRGGCLNACHLSICPQPIRCINHINPEIILNEVESILDIKKTNLRTIHRGIKCQDYEFHFHFEQEFDPSIFENPTLKMFRLSSGANKFIYASNWFMLSKKQNLELLAKTFPGSALVISEDIDRNLSKIIGSFTWKEVIFNATNADFSDETQKALVKLISNKIPVKIVYRGDDQKRIQELRSRSLQRSLSIFVESESKESMDFSGELLVFSSRYEIDERGKIWFILKKDSDCNLSRPDEWSAFDKMSITGDLLAYLYVFERVPLEKVTSK